MRITIFLLLWSLSLCNLFGQGIASNDGLLKEKIVKASEIINGVQDAASAIDSLRTFLNKDLAALELIYPSLILRHPKNAEIPYSIAFLFKREGSLKTYYYLEKAVEIEPKMTKAWLALGAFAYSNSDFVAQAHYLKQGVASNPNDPELAYAYSLTLSGEGRRKSFLKVGNKFPNTEFASKAFFWLALESSDLEEKIKYYDKIKSIYLLKKYRVSADAMNSYYNLLLEHDVKKTIPLLQQLLSIKFRSDDWGLLLIVSQQIIMINDLLDKQKGKEALEILKNIKIPYFSSEPTDLLLVLEAKAMAMSQNVDAAYDHLIEAFIKKTPNQKIFKEILSYGFKLKKDSEQVRKDILSYMRRNSLKATNFKLKKSMLDDSVSLDALRGKIVLVTYWFPKCIPCRTEFLSFEQVLKKFDPSAVNYLAINIVAKQEVEVPALIMAKNYSFTSLEEGKYRDKGNLNNRGIAPANFLIDKEGCLAFENFRIDELNKADLELMISLLL